MRIFCDLKKVKENELEDTPGGDYLAIKIDRSPNPVLLPLDKFNSLFQEGQTVVSVPSSDPLLDEGFGQTKEEGVENPSFKELMAHLSEKIGINEYSFEDDEDELIVQSDLGAFLELPWENLGSRRMFVFRGIPSQQEDEVEKETKNNLLLLISHARDGVRENLVEEMNNEIKAIYDSVQNMVEENNQRFRIESIFLLKHTTKKSLESIIWNNYNLAHFIMHGTDDGYLKLEKPEHENYKESDPIKIEDLISLLSKCKFKLIFLSLCFSGGGMSDEKDNLALQIIKGGFSEYVIGYSKGVGGRSAKIFSELFYKRFMNDGEIKTAYKEALKSFHKEHKTNIYKPLLYMRSQP